MSWRVIGGPLVEGICREGVVAVCVRPGEVLRSKAVLLTGHFPLAFGNPGLLGLARLPDADGSEEGLEVVVEIIFFNAEVPVEEAQKLLLHEVDLGDGEAKVLVSSNGTVPSPVLVLGRRVVKVLGREDERSQEDSVDGAAHALGNGRETSS